jgi:hypothetical protein
MRALPPLLFAFATSAAIACSPPVSPAVDGEHVRIAQMHKSKCGSCHSIVPPGTRSRAVLEAAFARHRNRLRLSEAEWSEMIDYLAKKENETSLAP